MVRSLQDTPTTTLGELAERIAAEEADTTPDRLDSTDRKRVYISLYQSHLPALADAGVVSYDRNRGDVERLDAADVLDERLRRLDEATTRSAGDRSHLRYAGLAVELAVVAGALNLPPFGALSPSLWGGIGVGVLAVLAGASVWDR